MLSNKFLLYLSSFFFFLVFLTFIVIFLKLPLINKIHFFLISFIFFLKILYEILRFFDKSSIFSKNPLNLFFKINQSIFWFCLNILVLFFTIFPTKMGEGFYLIFLKYNPISYKFFICILIFYIIYFIFLIIYVK